MATVTLNGELYFDTRTESQWLALSKIIPRGFLCVAFVTDGNDTIAKLKIGDGVEMFADLPYIGGDIDIDDVNTAINTALTNYYTSAQTDSAIQTAINTAIASVWTLKGRVDTVNDLPASGNKNGDVYMVGLSTDAELDEYYWTGTAWEHFGKTLDLSGYYTRSEIDTLLAGYVQAEAGKGLSTNDFTTAEKNKLAGLSNYDDTALSGRVTNIEADYLKSTDKLIINCQLT